MVVGACVTRCRASLQTLGYMKVLARSIWKQTRCAEAEEWIVECSLAIEKMGNGKFAKYQDDERLQLEGDVEALKEWRHQCEAQRKHCEMVEAIGYMYSMSSQISGPVMIPMLLE